MGVRKFLCLFMVLAALSLLFTMNSVEAPDTDVGEFVHEVLSLNASPDVSPSGEIIVLLDSSLSFVLDAASGDAERFQTVNSQTFHQNLLYLRLSYDELERKLERKNVLTLKIHNNTDATMASGYWRLL